MPTIPGQAGGRALYAQRGSEYFRELGRRGAAARKANLRVNIVAALNEVVGKIADQARENSSWSSKISDAIKVSEVKEQDNNYYVEILVDLNIAPEARAFEYGSGLHATKDTPRLIPIAAKNAPNLVFWWESGGKLFVGPRLPHGHPGVKAKPYIHPAIDQYKDEMKNRLKSAFKRTFISVGVVEINVSI